MKLRVPVLNSVISPNKQSANKLMKNYAYQLLGENGSWFPCASPSTLITKDRLHMEELEAEAWVQEPQVAESFVTLPNKVNIMLCF